MRELKARIKGEMSEEELDRRKSEKYIKTKKVPVILKFKHKDGGVVKFKATKIVKDKEPHYFVEDDVLPEEENSPKQDLNSKDDNLQGKSTAQNGCGKLISKGAYSFNCGEKSKAGNIQLCKECKEQDISALNLNGGKNGN